MPVEYSTIFLSDQLKSIVSQYGFTSFSFRALDTDQRKVVFSQSFQLEEEELVIFKDQNKEFLQKRNQLDYSPLILTKAGQNIASLWVTFFHKTFEFEGFFCFSTKLIPSVFDKTEFLLRFQELCYFISSETYNWTTIVNFTDDSVFLKNESLEYMLVNRSFLLQHDLSLENVIGKTDIDLFDTDYALSMNKIDVDILQHKTTFQQKVLLNQKELWIQKYPMHLPDGFWGIWGTIRDITEHESLRKELQTQKEHLNSILCSIDDAVITIDANETVTYMNQKALEVLKISYDQSFGMNIRECCTFLHPITKNRMQRSLYEWLIEKHFEKTASELILLTTITEQEYMVSLSIFPLAYDKNKVHGMVLVIRKSTHDVEMKSKIERNQRTQHEIEYQKTIRRNLAKSLSNSPLGMMYWKYSSGKATVLEWNRTAEKLFGWSAKEMVGYNFMEKLYYPDDVESSHHRIQQLQESKHSYHFQNKCYTKNNQILTIKWFVSYIKEDADGAIYGMSLAENLTEIENAKQNMDLLKKQLEYALEGSRAGSWDWYIDIDRLDVNSRWLEIFGYQEDKIRKIDYLSKEYLWLSCIHPDDLSKYNEEMQKHLTKQSDYYHCEYRILTKDSKWIWIEDRGKITQVSESGTPVRMSGTIQNITYQRKVFQDLQIRNSISSVFVEYTDDSFFPELLKNILQLTGSKEGAIGYFREDQSCHIASLSDSICKGTSYKFPFKLMFEDWQKTLWGKHLLHDYDNLRIFPRLPFLKGCISFQQSIVIPIIHMEHCIGFFITSNVSSNYSSEYFDVANTIATRMSHLFYSRLQSIFNEEKRYIAEHNLIASEEKLEGALEASNIGSWEWQMFQDHIDFDTRFMRILGYSEQAFKELNVTKWNQIIHPDDVSKNESDYQKHFLGLKPHHGVDIRLKHRNGSWIWVTKRGKFTDYDQEGNPIQMNGTITEITKVKQAQLEAREQRDELEWLLAGHQELLTKISDKSLFSYIAQTLSRKIPKSIIFVFQATTNQKALRLETYETSDETFKKSLVQWLLPKLSQYEIPITNEYLPIFSSNTLFQIPKSLLLQSMGFFSKSVTKLFQNILGIQHIHMIGFTGNKGHMGSAMIVQLNKESIQHSKTIESFVYQASLVLERILLEAEEQANRTRLEQVTEQSKSIIWETDLNGTITFISSYVKELLGYTPEELIRNKSWAELHTEQEMDIILQLFNSKLAKGDSYKNVFTELKTKDGEILYVSSNAVPIIKNHGISGYRGTDYDITILKNMDQAKNEFINTVSHEMRTPLTVVREANTILEMEALTSQQRHVLEISKKNIERLSRTINDVLDYQKLQAKKVELIYHTIDLRKFFKEIMDSYTVVAEKKHLSLSIQMKTSNPFLSTDEDKLYEVIGNLLDNAIKYSDQGSVSIRVEDKDSDTLCCIIQDTGLGIDKKEIPKLFRAFSQTSAVNTKKTGSTGLGLAICKEIVHLLQGSISVESKIGEGTTFFVMIPRKKGKRKE